MDFGLGESSARGATPGSAKPRAIPEAFKNLDEVMGLLGKELEVLESKISPVLTPEPPRVEKEQDKLRPAGLAGSVGFFTDRAATYLSKVRSLNERVEL